ncbi:ABC transporter permease [Gemmatimonas sp.]
MISLAGRDILHQGGKFAFTGVGLGLLIGVTLTMAGVYRGMIDDGRALLDNSGAELWVVQQQTLGPYAEPSSIPDDLYRGLRSVGGVQEAVNVTYLTMEVREQRDGRESRVMLVGVSPGGPGTSGWPPHLIAGRHLTRSHFEAVADVSTGFRLGDQIRIRHHLHTVVGLTQRMVSSAGDPMVFIPLRDAQAAQFQKDDAAVRQARRRTELSPALNPPGSPAVLAGVLAAQETSHFVNAVLVRLAPSTDPAVVATNISRWRGLTVFTRTQMEALLVGKLIATSARQIGLFLVILSVVSAAIVAFIIYTMTLGKMREIAVLKLIGTRNRTISGMILQQSVALGVIGFAVGKIAASIWAPVFPKYVLLVTRDAVAGFAAVLLICVVASLIAINAALRIDPADAIGG